MRLPWAIRGISFPAGRGLVYCAARVDPIKKGNSLPAYSVQSFEFLRVGVFCGLVGAVYYFLFRWWIARLRGEEPRTAVARVFCLRATGAVLTGLALLGVLCIPYGFFIEPYWLKVTRHELRTPKLPEGTRVRIVHIADLHVRENGPRERKLPDLVRDLEPDLILHTGDFFGRGDGLDPVLVSLLRSWAVPQFACKGNLDRLGNFAGVMRDAGITVLNGSFERLALGDARLTIAGYASGKEMAMPAGLAKLPADTFNIVLYHHPQGFPQTWVPQTWGTGADLMLAGHTHGGQIRLPFYGALVTLDRYGKCWESGFFEEQGVSLIVSRGLGCEPFTPEMRFLCRPEVIVLELIGTGESSNRPVNSGTRQP